MLDKIDKIFSSADRKARSGTAVFALRPLRFLFVLLLALVLALSCTLPLPAVMQSAWAVTEETEDEPDELQQRIEQTAQDYNDALARIEELEQQISENEEKIAQIEADLPEQQERAAAAVRLQYKMQRETPGIIEMILGSESITDFITSLQYVLHIQNSNLEEIEYLEQMRSELQATQESLEQAMLEAQEEEVAAQSALAEAQAAREEAQRLAEEEAAAQAEEEAAAAAEEASSQESSEESSDTSSTSSSSSSSSTSTSVTTESVSSDGADWSSDKATFVEQWASRIDAYLAGSPLAGQGATFAAAAWDYGVDPRWSPAISCTESSKGLYCFLPYNAWGWGNYSWSSWEEAIDAHVRGLARGYGYTISIEAAKKYCPDNWEHWYNTTLSQMNLI